MAGARGIMYLRWRPLLDGDLFGAFGPYGMDGGRTDRSRAVSGAAKWIGAPERERLFASKPVKGQIGIVYAPESQVHTYALRRSTEPYARSLQGAYQGFFDRNIQADWVHIDDIGDWDLLYLPYPVMLSAKSAGALKGWVKAGGTLIAEGCPAYFGDGAHVSPVQPGSGLDELFGVRESYVEFTPDLLEDLVLTVGGDRIWGGEYLQCYELQGAEAAGWYEDGRIAAADHCYGRGKTRLIGTMAGYGYGAHGGAEGRYRPPVRGETSFFEGCLAFAGKRPLVRVSDSKISARLHRGEGGTYLWIANPLRRPLPARVEVSALPGEGSFSSAVPVRGSAGVWREGTLSVEVPAREVIIYELR
jgi:beta-galactosidase